MIKYIIILLIGFSAIGIINASEIDKLRMRVKYLEDKIKVWKGFDK